MRKREKLGRNLLIEGTKNFEKFLQTWNVLKISTPISSTVNLLRAGLHPEILADKFWGKKIKTSEKIGAQPLTIENV